MDWLNIQENSNFSNTFCAGPKARGLMTLFEHNITIPDSWILCYEALYQFCEPQDLHPYLCFPDDNQDHYHQWTSRLRKKPLPESWEALLTSLCSKYQGQNFIVRSSHNLEDTDSKSFAGTYLSKVCKAQVSDIFQAMMDICVDAYQSRVQVQLLEAGYNPGDFRPGIIIQPHLAGQASGILFSKNPSNPWSQERYCEWSAHAAEKLVTGTVSPSSETWSAGNPPDNLIMKELDLLCSTLESTWPLLDAEWMYSNFQLILLQARPVADQSLKLAKAYENRSFSMNRKHMKERFPEPLSRLGWSVLHNIIASNLSALEGHFGLINPPESEILVNDRGVIYSNSDFFELKNVRWKKTYLFRFLRPKDWLKIALSFLRNRNLTVLKFRMTELYLRPVIQSILNEWPPLGDSESTARIESDQSSSIQEQIRALRNKSRRIFSSDMSTFVLREVLNKFFVQILDGSENVQLLLNQNRKLNKKLFHDVKTIQDMIHQSEAGDFVSALAKGNCDPSLLSPSDHKKWFRFIETWGFMNSSWDIKVPSWKESPEHLAPFFSKHPSSHKESTATNKPPTDHSSDSRRAELLRRLRNLDLESHFDRFSGIVEADDLEHYEGAKFLSEARSLLLKAGENLSKRKILTHRDQVFGLTLDEVCDALSKTPAVSKSYFAQFHIKQLERAENTEFPEELGKPMTAPLNPGTIDDPNLQGITVSAGSVRGRLLIVKKRTDLRDLNPDTILAVTNPNPDYIPLFSRIKGFICESGGLLAHSFVVCREIMLPAITDVKDLNVHFKNGDEIILDATNGQIRRAEPV